MVALDLVDSELRPARAIAAIYEPVANPFKARVELARALAADFELAVEPHEIAVDRMIGGTPSQKYAELVRLMNISRTTPRSVKLLAYLASLSRLDATAGPCGHA